VILVVDAAVNSNITSAGLFPGLQNSPYQLHRLTMAHALTLLPSLSTVTYKLP